MTASSGSLIARVLSWVGSIVVLTGAWFIVADTPTAAEKRPRFDVPVSPGEWGEGRNLAARAIEMTLSDQLENADWAATGNWLVVQVDAATVVDSGSLNMTQFAIHGVTYNATDRTDSTMRGRPLFVGIPQSGSLAFDLPAGLPTGIGELRLGLESDTELDSVVVVAIDLADVPRVSKTSIKPPSFGER